MNHENSISKLRTGPVVSIVNKSNNPNPSYETEGAAGMDIRAFFEGDPIIIKKQGGTAIIPTGIFIAVPEGYEIQVRPRSGLAFKSGVTVLNAPGTVDQDFRGEIKVCLINHSNEHPFRIDSGDRIAQLVLSKVERAVLQPVEILSTTERGEGGFGHTGVK